MDTGNVKEERMNIHTLLLFTVFVAGQGVYGADIPLAFTLPNTEYRSIIRNETGYDLTLQYYVDGHKVEHTLALKAHGVTKVPVDGNAITHIKVLSIAASGQKTVTFPEGKDIGGGMLGGANACIHYNQAANSLYAIVC